MLSRSFFVNEFFSKHTFVFSTVIALFVIVIGEVSAEFSLDEGDVCTSQKLRGTCKRLQKCPYVYQQTLSGEAPEMVCNFSDFEPVVCCPQESTRHTPKPSIYEHNENYLTTSTTIRATGKPLTNQDLPGQVAQRKCSEYSKAVYTLVRPPILLGNAKPVNKSLCAIDNKSQKLIVGGTKSGAKEFPHMTAIGYESTNQEIAWNCGGTLISERFVLTAAHCSYSSERGNAVWARVGDLNLKNSDDASPKNYRIVERIKHPNYKKPALYHDIALMKLEKDVQFNAWVRPACLPDPGSNQDFEMAIATGWGRVDWTDEEGSEDLLKVTLPLVSNSRCNSFYEDDNYRLNRGIVANWQICAGQQGKDTCQGDSGGPLVIINKRQNCMYDVVGITSVGKICGSIAPGVYTKISFYVPWIESIIWDE